MEGNKPVIYIKSLLSVGSPLAVKRLLKSKGIVASRGDVIVPKINIEVVPQLPFMEAALDHIAVESKARKVAVPKDISDRVSKYTITVE